MPNWCSTNITINYPEDEQRLKGFQRRIDDWTSKNYCSNGFGKNWLGNIVGFSGIGNPDSEDPNEHGPRCRGSLVWSDKAEGGSYNLTTETAWAPMLEMWRLLIDKYLPGAELLYTAEELGCEILCSNDPAYVGTYYVDITTPNIIDSYYDLSEGETVKLLQEISGDTNVKDIDSLVEMINEKKNHNAYVLRCEYADVDEFA